MTKLCTLLAALTLAAATAQAQPANSSNLSTPGGLLSAGTPGVAPGTTGTTFGTPGAEAAPKIPGGSIPMGAATQQDNPQTAGQIDYNNSSNSGIPSTR